MSPQIQLPVAQREKFSECRAHRLLCDVVIEQHARHTGLQFDPACGASSTVLLPVVRQDGGRSVHVAQRSRVFPAD